MRYRGNNIRSDERTNGTALKHDAYVVADTVGWRMPNNAVR